MKILSVVFVAFLFSMNTLFAITLGKSGEPYLLQEVEWQKMFYQDEKVQLTASFPGCPKTGITSDWCFLYSQYNGSEYEIHFNPKLQFSAPSTLNDFIAYFKTEPHTVITPLETAQPNIIYVIELRTYTQDDKDLEQISRVYATKDNIYFTIVVGTDFSLADTFFSSFQIGKFSRQDFTQNGLTDGFNQ